MNATYRLQLHSEFGFHDAAAITDYLARLGVSHVYCSPYLQAAPGSTHGYDVTAHDRVNRELGGDEGHRAFMAAVAANGLGQVLDIVPNHMSISSHENRWWVDVLENGPSSVYADYFDVEWAPPESRLRNMVLIPVLGDHYGRVLEAGELTIARQGGSMLVCYAEHRYPIDPRSLAPLLGHAAGRTALPALAYLADAFGALPRPTAIDRASVKRRHRDKAVLQELLERLLVEDRTAAEAVDAAVAEWNGNRALLHELLEAQSYRLAWWRSAGRDLGYRRFFDINTLIGLRMEDERVFEDTHRLVLQWVRDGALDGLRVDHPDGLRDPRQYCERLAAAAPGKWIVLEKILESGEQLAAGWPVAGTTGYDFLNRAFGVFVDPAAERPLTDFYAEFTGQPTDYHQLVVEKKLYVLREVLGSDVNRLADLLVDIVERHPTHRDYSRNQLAAALRELVAHFPVYRTYVRPGVEPVSGIDRQYIKDATEAATASRPDLEAALFDFIRDVLVLEIEGPLETELVTRFQQLTGPAMAKGVEDTAFYLFNRFVALNEVGGDPSVFGITVGQFHDAARQAQAQWPESMLATATHDTKRGEDVRARLAVLSEIPQEWCAAVRRWSARAERHRSAEWPDRNTEYFFYQTLVGAWPLDLDRAATYMEKATREGKAYTSWTTPNEQYDRAVRDFVAGVLADDVLMADVRGFVEPLVPQGWINALGQVLLKLTAPGIPDIYQGTELWSLHLVDPDNRRPVDYDGRRRALDLVHTLAPEQIWDHADDGLPKLWVVHKALQLRQSRPELFGRESRYEPLCAKGTHAHRVLAFVRNGGSLTVLPRLNAGRDGWAGTVVHLPAGRWRHIFTGDGFEGEVAIEHLLRRFPVALLERLA